MLKYLKLFRWPNLLMIALTQILIKSIVFDFILKTSGIAYPISSIWFAILVVSTIFVAIGGYIGNDIADIEIDKLNRPNRPLSSASISVSLAKNIQMSFEILGFILGLMVAIHIGNPSLASIHLFIIILMRFYANSLKCKGLIGNTTVALSTAMVPAIIWLFGIYALKGIHVNISVYLSKINIITLFYVGFAFWFTLIREIVKDLEDLPGDRQQGCRTLAVQIPVRKLKHWVIVLSAIGLNGILLFQFILYNHKDLSSYILFLANFSSLDVIILLLLIPKLIKANSSMDFGKIGNTLKIIMIAGILNLLFILI